MFEGKLPGTATAQPLDKASAGQGRLRPVSWSDLVASFDPDSARHIAELADGKPDINLDDLANGKAADGMGRHNSNGAESDDPRT